MIRQLPLPLAFNPEHGFGEYFPGGNAEAVAHLRLAAQGQGEPLIYLWGEAGIGKSHLLQACCLDAHRAGFSVSYLPLRNLLEYGCEVLNGLASQRLICMDDLDSVAGDETWERSLFGLFNRLRDQGHGLIVSARTPPAAIPVILPDLKTRLSWGLTLMLRPLLDEDKLSALTLRAKTLGLDMPPQVGRFLLSTHRRDLNSLMDLLGQLERATLAAKRKLTIPFLKTYLEENP